MAIAHDASNAGATGTGTLSWTHTPSGTPRGVWVGIGQNQASGDQVTSVTYGGVAMTRRQFVSRGVTDDDGTTYTYFLGASIPTGAQTVLVTVGGATKKNAIAATQTAGGDTEVDSVNTTSGLFTNPAIVLSTASSTTACYAAAHISESAAAVSVTAGGTQIAEAVGVLNDVGSFQRLTALGGGGDVTLGWTYANDEIAGAAIAIREVGDVPAVYPIAAGTIVFSAAGAATVAPAPPAHNAGDLLVTLIGIHTSGTKTVTVPAGWTAVTNAEASGGGGVFGALTGPSRIKAIYQVAPDTSTSAVTITLPGTETNSIAWAQTLAYRLGSPTQNSWSVNGANGIDSTTGTPLTAAMGTDPGLVVGDYVIKAASIGTTAGTYAAVPTITGTGLTATQTIVSNPSTTLGHDAEGTVSHGRVTSALTSGVPTPSQVVAGTTTEVRGPIILVRLRAVAPPPATSISLIIMAPPNPGGGDA